MKRFILLLGALLSAVALAACGNDSSGTATTTGGDEHNAADVTFAQSMIAHHRQAVEMANLAITRASAPQVTTLARQIRDAQTPEITTMVGWLNTWGQPTTGPSADSGMASGQGMASSSAAPMSSMPMPSMEGGSAMPMPTESSSTDGMMSEQDMTSLEAASGRDFDRTFLQMMIEHHQGAVAMATTELRDGRYGPANQLARTIQTTQTAEITTMRDLLTKI